MRVLTLYPGGMHWEALAACPEVELAALFERRRGGTGAVRQRADAVARLRHELRRQPPDVVYGFLYVASAIAVEALRGRGAAELERLPLVWGVRSSNARLGLKELPAYHLCRLRSRRASLIVANSRAGVDYHRRKGFRPLRYAVVENGIDTETFRPRAEEGAGWRQSWGVAAGAPLVGLVGRMHAMKDHSTFLRAAALVAERVPELRLACVGGGPERLAARLARRADALGLGERLCWAGEHERMADIYSAFDLLVSSSAYGEGFSNAVAEAMACGVPCAVTDVGDAARIVGDTGAVAPPGDAPALAAAIERLLALPAARRRELGARARRRIVERFSAAAATAATESVLSSLVADSRGAR